MISGTVTGRIEATVVVRVRGPSGVIAAVTAVIDTVFSSALTLPDATVVRLGLPVQSRGRGRLADGSVRRYSVFVAEIEWDGRWRPVLVYRVGDEVLLGMGLLAGHELKVAVQAGGAVEVTPLP